MIDERERRALEKLLFAYILRDETWDGEKYRGRLDDILNWILDPEDRQTWPYVAFDMLRGRIEPGFRPFLLETLGYDEEPKEELWARYGERAREPLERLKEGRR
ncbi:MAG: hypothetical protein KM310_06620 [Clostridiales bacterium]|nr:hypothetical protein [Clostridiales bacterium]